LPASAAIGVDDSDFDAGGGSEHACRLRRGHEPSLGGANDPATGRGDEDRRCSLVPLRSFVAGDDLAKVRDAIALGSEGSVVPRAGEVHLSEPGGVAGKFGFTNHDVGVAHARESAPPRSTHIDNTERRTSALGRAPNVM
jgi:hypothetical protein